MNARETGRSDRAWPSTRRIWHLSYQDTGQFIPQQEQDWECPTAYPPRERTPRARTGHPDRGEAVLAARRAGYQWPDRLAPCMSRNVYAALALVPPWLNRGTPAWHPTPLTLGVMHS